jgi:hypothetical protein
MMNNICKPDKSERKTTQRVEKNRRHDAPVVRSHCVRENNEIYSINVKKQRKELRHSPVVRSHRVCEHIVVSGIGVQKRQR